MLWRFLSVFSHLITNFMLRGNLCPGISRCKCLNHTLSNSIITSWERERERLRSLCCYKRVSFWPWSVLLLLGINWFFLGVTAPSGPGPPHYRGFPITLRHTTLGRTPLDEWSVRRTDFYLITHKRQTSVHTAGFEHSLAASERLQTPRPLGLAGVNW
jgi:hypothetical protein